MNNSIRQNYMLMQEEIALLEEQRDELYNENQKLKKFIRAHFTGINELTTSFQLEFANLISNEVFGK